MSPRRPLRTLLGLTAGLLALASAPGLVPAAQAVTGSPPITVPDSATVYQGNIAFLQPVNNDHDPDNEVLALCRMGPERIPGILVENVGNDVAILAKPKAKPGTYTLTYYACDFSYLTAGTITLTVQELPKVTVKKVASRPGRLRVTNPADFKIRFLYGSFKEDRPDGSLLIAKHSTVTISVHRTQIDWVASDRKGELFLGSGHVTGIKLAGAAGRHLAHVSLSPRLVEAWRSAS